MTSKQLAQIEEGKRIERLTGNTDHYPIRYVVTHIAQDGDLKGLRVLTGRAWGSETYDTPEQAQKQIDLMLQNNTPKDIAGYWGSPDTLEVRAVKCYPGHHDPCRTVFEK